MSSSPMTKRSQSPASSSRSSPPSSPPSAADSPYDPEIEKAQEEEDRLAAESKQQRDDDRLEAEKSEYNKRDNDTLKDLDWFLSRSQGFSGKIMEQLRDALQARKKQTTAQPRLVTGGQMREYQLEGLTWLTCLYQIGLNGILADEMGLGKTVQLISFLAFLRDHGTNGPFLILGPLSTISNWIKEFNFWTPDIKAIMYHGNPQVRDQLRRSQLKGDAKGPNFPVVCTSYEICMRDKKYLANYPWKFIVVDEGHRLKNFNSKLVQELKQYQSESRLILTGTPLQNNLAELWSLLNFLIPEAFSDLEQFESMFDFSDVQDKATHKEFLSKERQQRTVASLHAILKPFLLRRVKDDVESNLPKKREYILYAPLTTAQKELYQKIKSNDVRLYLEEKALERLGNKLEDHRVSSVKGTKRKAGSGTSTPNKSRKSSRDSTPASSIRSGRRGRPRKSYEEVSDRQWFKQLEEESESESIDSEEEAEKEKEETLAQARKQVLSKKLQNPIMQLRLACNSPHNFYWPWGTSDPDSTLVTSSGKMLMLDRLIPALFKRGHKIILFSQFSRQLDILEEWAATLRGWPVCRIDGSVHADDRADAIESFNTKKSHKLFLLSTRAGGLGINLTAADTVILFDSDWNPQQDLQAQDRAHRIGQTKPVIVYRLATKGTVEQTLLEKADGKRRLEKLVIQKDKFRSIWGSKRSANQYKEIEDILGEEEFETWDPEEMQSNDQDTSDRDKNTRGKGSKGKAAGKSGGEAGQKEIISDTDLEILLDRSPAAYEKASKGEAGLVEGARFKGVETKKGEVDILSGIGR